MSAHRATQEKSPRSKSSRSTPQFYNPCVSSLRRPVLLGVQPPALRPLRYLRLLRSSRSIQPSVSGPSRCPASGVRCPICLISPISPIRLICPIRPIGLHHKNHKKNAIKYIKIVCVSKFVHF
jgi:hypothetical protein